jgi:hypothetical protein
VVVVAIVTLPLLVNAGVDVPENLLVSVTYTLIGLLVTAVPIATFPASFTWNETPPEEFCTRNIPGKIVIGTPELVEPKIPMVAAMSDAIANTVVVTPAIVTRSPTFSSVRNLVPAPTSAEEPDVVDTVPVAANDGFAFTVSLAVPVGASTPIAPLLPTRNFEPLPIMKLMEPPDAILLIRYSCVELLKPWNCPSAPFWS